jgi:uncharacterized membrane protein YqhA
MVILLCALLVLVIISNVASMIAYIRSADRKAQHTMIEVNAIRELKNTIEKYLSKKST